jgi:hypothetical protein
MKTPRRKDNKLMWLRVRLENELRRKWCRFVRRVLIRSYIKEYIDNVLHDIESRGEYVALFNSKLNDKEDDFLTYKLISMIYGLNFKLIKIDNELFDLELTLTKKDKK